MSNTVTDSRPVNVRKPHRCRICGERIAPGERVERRKGFDSSEGPWTIWMHPECTSITVGWTEDDWISTYPGDVQRPDKQGLTGAAGRAVSTDLPH